MSGKSPPQGRPTAARMGQPWPGPSTAMSARREQGAPPAVPTGFARSGLKPSCGLRRACDRRPCWRGARPRSVRAREGEKNGPKSGGKTWWAWQGLNLRPLRCQHSALPLSYTPTPVTGEVPLVGRGSEGKTPSPLRPELDEAPFVTSRKSAAPRQAQSERGRVSSGRWRSRRRRGGRPPAPGRAGERVWRAPWPGAWRRRRAASRRQSR